jgi:hypothetical protein
VLGKLNTALVLLVALVIASPAGAQSAADTAIDATTLESPVGPSAFTLLPSAESVDSASQLHFGLTTVYSRRPLLLVRGEDEREAVGARVDLDVSIAAFMATGFTFGVVMPLVLVQYGVFGAPLRGSDQPARVVVISPRDLRLGGSWLAYSRGPGGRRECTLPAPRVRVLVLGEMILATGTPGLFAGADGVHGSLGVSADYGVSAWQFSGHTSLKVRPVVEVGAARVGSELRVAGGVARRFANDRLQVTVEGEARLRLNEQGAGADGSQHTVEYGVGLRYRPPIDEPYTILFHIGSGIGGLGAPALRVIFGIRYGNRLPTRRN